MKKVMVIVRIVDGDDDMTITETEPVFLIGMEEKEGKERPVEQWEILAETVALELTGALQLGIRRVAPKHGVKVWPLEG